MLKTITTFINPKLIWSSIFYDSCSQIDVPKIEMIYFRGCGFFARVSADKCDGLPVKKLNFGGCTCQNKNSSSLINTMTFWNDTY